MRRIGLVRDDRYLGHATGLHHVETPRRLLAINTMLDASGLSNSCRAVAPRSAAIDELCRVHTEAHIEKILDTAGETLRYLDPDTVTGGQSCAAAFLAAGGCIAAVDEVMSGGLDAVFALVRPPGHHAERGRQMGFCLFNNAAVAAAHALCAHGLKRVLIVDWDVHHPNGTQHIFEDRADVLLFSTHRYPFFPGTGAGSEVGQGAGRGFTVNVPLPARATDADYAHIFSAILEPVAREYRPELVLVSAGFDAHRDDPIGGMLVSEDGFALMTDAVMRIADACCGGKALFVLEGGYDLGALRKSVQSVLETLQTGLPDRLNTRCRGANAAPPPLFDQIEDARLSVQPYWKCL